MPFLENGNYAEANLFAVDSSVSGVVNDRADLVRDHQSRDTGDIAESTQFYTAAIKLKLTDRLGFGVLYDQPFQQTSNIRHVLIIVTLIMILAMKVHQ